ncbi:probable transmembrane reductase CYB561D1 isoform X1 [Lepisosteus oculatus]|uniref:probable transmembrane reductase CYB561D1 isoform X1 n=2 Tax=Lepisosteus oculatus TaxID=7918 RepID=UPI0037249470
MQVSGQYSPAGEGLGMGDFWLYAWLRKVSVITAHVVALGFTVFVTLLSRTGTSLFSWHPTCMALAVQSCTYALDWNSVQSVLPVHDGGHPAVLPGGHALLLQVPEGQDPGALVPAGPGGHRRRDRTGLHRGQQERLQPAPPHLLAQPDRRGHPGGYRVPGAVRALPAVPEGAADLLSGPAQALPCHLRPSGLPAGHRHRGDGHVHRLVPGHHQRGDVVRFRTAAPLPCPGRHEPDHQRLPTKKEIHHLT